jgi:pilus assembly protein CpaB
MEVVQRMLSTRGGTVAIGGFAAVTAAVMLLLYLNQYRDSVNSSGEPITVLVAKSLIEKGTPGDIVGLKGLFQTAEVPKNQLKEGAVTDPATLRGTVATADVYPGGQLTTGDFAASARGALGTKIADDQRAISVPVDAAHGMMGRIQAGDLVDVYASFNVDRGDGRSHPVLKVLAQNVLVLEAPSKNGTGVSAGSNTVNVVLRTDFQDAPQIAFTADNGKLWLVLRPRAGARVQKPGLATADSVLFGVKPVTVFARVRTYVGAGR